MLNANPTDVLDIVLNRVSGVNWQTERHRLTLELAEYLTDDLYRGDYELVNAPMDAKYEQRWNGDERVVIIVHGFGLPDKATLVRGSDRRWRIESYLAQCTGCLGTGEILDGPCGSCSGTGWGLRPSPIQSP